MEGVSGVSQSVTDELDSWNIQLDQMAGGSRVT